MSEERASARVIWLHGLGDTGKSWADMEERLGRRVPWARWSFPDAPTQPVTCNGGQKSTSWFDLRQIPVVDGKEHPGLGESVARIHAMIKQAEVRDGVPPSRVVLGGFSQGGLLSLHAGLTAPAPLAGLCILSGWMGSGLPSTTASASAGDAKKHAGTPILHCHGTADQVVPFEAGRRSVAALKRSGCTAVEFKSYSGLGHSLSEEEIDAVQAFLLKVLPPVALPEPVAAPVAAAGVPAASWQASSRDGECRVEFNLGRQVMVKDILLDISSSELKISGALAVHAAWPAMVDVQKAHAKFLKTSRRLVVMAPKS